MITAPSRYLRPLSVAIYYGALSIFSFSTEPSLFLWYFAFLTEFIFITLAANISNKLRKGDGEWFSGTGSILAVITYLPIPWLIIYFALQSVGEAGQNNNLFVDYAPHLIIMTIVMLLEYGALTFIEVKSNQVTDSIRQFVAYVLNIAVLSIVGLVLSLYYPAVSVTLMIATLAILRIGFEFILRRWLSKF